MISAHRLPGRAPSTRCPAEIRAKSGALILRLTGAGGGGEPGRTIRWIAGARSRAAPRPGEPDCAGRPRVAPDVIERALMAYIARMATYRVEGFALTRKPRRFWISIKKTQTQI